MLTRFGRYLRELRSRLAGLMVADMFCLLRLELELSVQANGLLIAREAGLDLPIDADHDAGRAERRYLHDAIGRAGLMALKPLQVTSRRDRWHRHLLRRALACPAERLPFLLYRFFAFFTLFAFIVRFELRDTISCHLWPPPSRELSRLRLALPIRRARF